MRALSTCVALLAMVSARSAIAAGDEEAWWASVGPDGVQRIAIRCGADFFDPNRIVVRARVPVELVISTTDDVAPQSFVIDLPAPGAGRLKAAVGPAQKKLPFLPSLHGRFQVACQDSASGPADPAQRSKKGTLTVVP